MKRLISTGCSVFLLSAGLLAYGGQSDQQTAPDNTKMNKGENGSMKHSADSGAQTHSDLQLMKEIRKAVVSDGSLSTYAHNVKIMAKSGKVTLKGPVHTEEEKSTIEAHAQKIAGEGNVINKITVKGDSK